ncbi:MAG: hypothetical protein ACYTGG_09045 [Planctomycetota bacterium]|jgi:hypothetical protein
MAMFVDRLKLKAALHSMRQYMSSVRPIFQGDVSDEVVEAATYFLYVRVAGDVFNSRFATRLARRLKYQLKFNDPASISARAHQIASRAESMRKALRTSSFGRTPESEFESNVRSVICSILMEANLPVNDPEALKHSFGEFDRAVRQIKEHLVGIKKQNHFIMRH